MFRLAAIEDAIERLTFLTQIVHTDEKQRGRVPKPEPVRRPGVTGSRPRKRISAEDKAYLAHLRANRGQLPPGLKFVAAS